VTKQHGQVLVYRSLTQTTNHVKCVHNNGNIRTTTTKKIGKEIFGDIDASVCPVKYEYGKDGKPFYMNGPYESHADVQKIINTLTEKCGVNGFEHE